MSLNRWCLVAAVCVFVFANATRANEITNGGFDTFKDTTGTPPLSDNRFTFNNASGSVLTGRDILDGSTGLSTGEGNASAAAWRITSAAFTVTGTAAGGILYRSVDYSNGPTGPGGFVSTFSTAATSGVLYEQLANPMEPNTPFLLTVDVFDRSITPTDIIGLPTTLIIQVRYGATIDSSTAISATLIGTPPPDGGKSTYTLTGIVPLAAAGQQTFVALGGSGLSALANTQVVFDNVDLQLLPEPASIATLGLASLLLLVRHPRRNVSACVAS